MTVAGVVVAAGAGVRLGADAPKALVDLGGRPLVAHALERLRAAGLEDLVVVHPPGQADRFAAAVAPHHPVQLVPGGDTRTGSVRAGVAALPVTEVVAVHDAARPLTPPGVVRVAVEAVVGGAVAAAPGQPVTDTLKQVRIADDGTAEVQATVSRADLWGVHTPQVVRRDVLDRALARAGDAATDDLGLVEAVIADGEVAGRIVLVPGDVRDLKVTWPADLAVAAALLQQDEARR